MWRTRLIQASIIIFVIAVGLTAIDLINSHGNKIQLTSSKSSTSNQPASSNPVVSRAQAAITTPLTTTTMPTKPTATNNTCVTTTQPFTTLTENDPGLLSSQSYTTEGMNGITMTCGSNPPIVTPPSNAIHYVGTMVMPTYTAPAQSTYQTTPANQETQADCIQNVQAEFASKGAAGESAEQYAEEQC